MLHFEQFRQQALALPPEDRALLAELLQQNGIKRVPVQSRGRMVGIVSRANLLAALIQLQS